MLFRIEVNEGEIVFNEGGVIVLKLDDKKGVSRPINLVTSPGNTADDFNKHDALCSRLVKVTMKDGGVE